nr:tetratricopeptide repeat protein [Methylonatrum kenyense]
MSGRFKGCLIAVALLGLLAACSPDVSELMERADQHRADGRYQSAIADYRNVLELDADHAEARLHLGETALTIGDYVGAEEALRRAFRLGVSADRIYPSLSRALLWQQKPEQLLGTITVDDSMPAPLQAELLAMHAEAHRQLRQTDRSDENLRKALAIDPDAVPALLVAGRLALDRGLLVEAKDYADEARNNAPQSAAAWLLTAQIQRTARDVSAAIDSYRQLLALDATDISTEMHFMARGALAELLASQRELEAAENVVQHMLQQAPRHPYPNYLAAILAIETDRLATANDHLQRAIAAAPNSLQIKTSLALLRLRQERFAQATALLREVVFAQPENIEARVLLAAGYRGLQQPRQATRVLTEGLAHADGDPRIIAQLARAMDGDVAELRQAIEQLSETDAAAHQIRLAAAEAFFGRGQTDAALAILSDMQIQHDEELLGQQLLIVASVHRGDLDKALHEAQALIDAYPGKPLGYNLLGGIHFFSERLDEAEAAFRKAVARSEGDPQAHLNLGLLAEARGDIPAAIRHFRDGLERKPGNIQAMLQLSDLLRRGEQHQEALAWAEQAAQLAPNDLQANVFITRQHLSMDNPEAAVANARVGLELAPDDAAAHGVFGVALLASGRPEEAAEALAEATRLAPDSPDLQLQLARAQAAAGRGTASAETFEALLLADPANVQARLTLGTWYIERQVYTDAIRHYEQLAELTERQNPVVLNNLAWLYQQVGDERDLETAQAALELAPDNAEILDTLGWIEHGRGHHEAAIGRLSKAHTAAPANARIRYHLGAALVADGSIEQGRQALREALDMAGDASWAEDARAMLEAE